MPISESSPPLHGLLVLDFTRALAGPFCTRLLWEAGAEVLKVEPVGHGDFARDLLPPYRPGYSGYFNQQNYGKRSVALDLKDEVARAAVVKLAHEVDVIVENFRPGVMERLGLGFNHVAKANPGIVYCSISGFGQDSPDVRRPGQDIVGQAKSGLLDTVRTPSGDPLVPNTSLTDIVTGLHAFNAILSALARGIGGCRIDSCILRSALQLHESLSDSWIGDVGRIRGEFPACHPIKVPRGIFQAANGYVAIDASGDDSWKRLASLMSRDDLMDMDSTRRSNVRADVLTIVSDWISKRNCDEVTDRLTAASVPASAVRSTVELANLTEFRDRRVVRSFGEDDDIGIFMTPVAQLGRSSEALAAECLGQSTYNALAQVAGLRDEDILNLMSRRAADITPDSLPPGFPSSRATSAPDGRTSKHVAIASKPLEILELGESLATSEAGRILRLAGFQVTKLRSPRPDPMSIWRDEGKTFIEATQLSGIADPFDAVIIDGSPSAESALSLIPDCPLVVRYESLGSEIVAEAQGGLSYIYGEEDGLPYSFGYPVVEVVAGAYLSALVMLACYRRTNSTPIVVSADHVAITLHDTSLVEAFWSKGQSGASRGTSDRKSLVPYGVFRAPNGHLAVAASQGGFARLAKALGREDLLADEDYHDLQARVENRGGVREIIENWLASKGLEEAERAVTQAGAVCARVRSLDEVVSDESYYEEGMLLRNPAHGPVAGVPFKVLSPTEVAGSKLTAERTYP